MTKDIIIGKSSARKYGYNQGKFDWVIYYNNTNIGRLPLQDQVDVCRVLELMNNVADQCQVTE